MTLTDSLTVMSLSVCLLFLSSLMLNKLGMVRTQAHACMEGNDRGHSNDISRVSGEETLGD